MGMAALVECQETIAPLVQRHMAEASSEAFELVGKKRAQRCCTIEKRFIEVEEDGIDHIPRINARQQFTTIAIERAKGAATAGSGAFPVERLPINIHEYGPSADGALICRRYRGQENGARRSRKLVFDNQLGKPAREPPGLSEAKSEKGRTGDRVEGNRLGCGKAEYLVQFAGRGKLLQHVQPHLTIAGEPGFGDQSLHQIVT